jgi:hypothetical protein
MSLNFDIAELLKDVDLKRREKDQLVRLFEYTQYLYDNDENLTKTLNLTKTAKDQLISRIDEVFEKD